MTSIRYLAGGNVDERQRLLDRMLSSWKGATVLHLVPARGRAIELESDHRFWLKRRQDTLTGLIYRIFEDNIRFKQFNNCRQIDDGIRSLIVKKAMEKRMAQPEGMIYFNRLLTDHDQEIDFPGIFRAVASFFSQLVQNNYQDRFVNDLAGKIIRVEEKGNPAGDEVYALESDLAWIFGDYEEIKKEIGAYDEDDVLSSVRDFLSRDAAPCPIKGADVIIFDGLIHLSRIEEDILYYLFGHVKEIWWPLDYVGGSSDPVHDFKESSGRESQCPFKATDVAVAPKGMEAYRIFAPMASFMDRLEAGGIETITEKCGDALYLNPLAEGLYIDGRLRETDNNSLRIRYFPGRVDEVRAIAREIKKIIHEDSLDISRDLGRIRIIFPELREYSSLIFEIFREYGIPFSLTSGLPLFSHPISDIFLLLFKLPLNHFKRGDIFRLFSSVLIRKKSAHCLNTDHGRISRLLAKSLLPGDDVCSVEALINGYAGKQPVADILDIEFIDKAAQRCGLNNLGDDIEGNDKGISSVRDYYHGKLIKSIESAEKDNLRWEYYRFIIQHDLLADTLKPFKGLIEQDNAYDIENIFSILLKDLGFPENIVDIPDSTDIPNPLGHNKMIRRDIKAYSLLKDLVSTSASELMIDNELFSVGSGRNLLLKFFRIFRNRLEASYLLDEQDPNVIRVSQWLEIRGRSFDYIFAGGLTDKAFPLREETNFISPEPSRNIFRVPDNIDMSRHLFSHLLRNYRKGLYLSSPGYADEKEVRPSNVFADIESMISDNSPLGQERIKRSFKWDDSPYIASEHEMLDASIIKGSPDIKATETPFPLKDVIVTNESLLEGIIRGIRAMGSRWALNGLFEYDGLTGKARGFQKFIKGKKDIFSASQLETLANCPMRYLFERVYGFKKMEVIGPDASPLAMGEHLHGVLSAFFKRLADQGKNVSGIGINRAFSQAKEVADDYFKSIPFLDSIEFFEHQKNEFLAGLDHNAVDSSAAPIEREGAFALLLRFEEKNFMDRIPDGIEYEFGFNGLSSPLLGRIRLRGFIDRFDRDINDRGQFYIYDYKTGALPSPIMIKKGLSFQLPVYIRALKTCLKAEKITAALYSLKKDNFLKDGPLGQFLCEHAGDPVGLDIAGVVMLDRYADRLMELIKAGCFHHSADMIDCGYCDFRYACHRDERRMDHLIGSGEDHGIYSGERNLETWKEVDNFRGEWKKVLEGMKKAFNLKTASGRMTHYESVLAFGQKLIESNNSLPFDRKYIDELLREIEDFKNRYLSSLSYK